MNWYLQKSLEEQWKDASERRNCKSLLQRPEV